MKGISPIIAAVLLIAITVAISTVVAGWFSTFTRSTTDQVTNRTAFAIDCTSANINIEDVYVTAGTNSAARAILKNTGFADNLVIQGAILYNTTGNNFTEASVPITNFDKGDLITLVFNNISVTTCPTHFSKVVVTTNCGGISDTFDGTPKCT
jgi:flagellin-like protein